MFNRDICKKCYLENDWDIEPIIDGRWGKGVYCPKSKKWLQHWKSEAPVECLFQMEHLIMAQEEEHVD